jgi:hypothetical protein
MAPYQIAFVCIALVVALGILGSFLFFSAESRYLRSAKDRATEADVRLHLGEPSEVTFDEMKMTRWTYQTRTAIQEGTNNAWTTIDSYRCDTYHLTFDDQAILRDWTSTSRTC